MTSRMRFTILYTGRTARLPRALSEVLESAGFSITRPRRQQVAQSSHRFEVELAVGAGGNQRRAARAQVGTRPATAQSLQGLRERVGRTQGEIARSISMTQPQLSRVEARRDHLTSTLRKYVRALGGRVEVVAVLQGKRIVLQGV